MIDSRPRGDRRMARIWLMALFALVVGMIAVGGMTRLTDSGLSITEWRPVTGAIPPLSEEAWQAEYDLYAGTPQFQIMNRDITMSEFRSIYWWEWGHRQLGRIVGLVWAIGFAGLLATRKMPPGYTVPFLVLGALGGLQGAIGWWMVASGLEDGMVSVAPYRLAVHLSLAFVILGTIAWYVLRLSRTEAELIQARRAREPVLMGWAGGLVAVAALQLVWGALVAGNDAGRAYTDWPLMAGGILPPDMWQIAPWWRNLFENDGTVQFFHRLTGYALAALAVAAFLRARRSPYRKTRAAYHGILGIVGFQIVLGIVTVMHAAPWYLAILHQLSAVALWVVLLRARFQNAYPRAQSVRTA